ncbi:sugar ABC transporter permease [Priestia aryabhattai]|uniref:ABC transporter permease n=1 Tax=Bacillaceae TaxID=186817 RepID=UPI000BA04F43|nr:MULTISPECIES: ABC transporter permease [Bacillaceae]MDT2047602.1 ABC transporter permease [Priestia flexa]OZT12488.1 sugar ABC transporter permease [Priestia aryabhattai]TDB55339.1 ABC transporter permease [Bacillus sp. CBEL-1]
MSAELVNEQVKTKKQTGQWMEFVTKYGTVVAILLVTIFFSIASPNFLTPGNISDILRSISIVTLIALGVTISLTVNGLDLSVGSTAGLATILSASMLVLHRQELLVALLIPILASLLVGLVNAFFVVKVKIPDILATLSMMFIVQGILLTYTKGSAIYTNMPLEGGERAPGIFIPSFLALGQGHVLGVPVPVIIMLLAVLVVHIFFTYTKYGRFFYVTGGNMEAARLSGIPVNRYRMYAYVLSSLLAGIGGVVLAARIGVGEVNAGAPFLMDAVAAAYIGFSVFGAGKPNIIGTLLGSILIGVLLNGLTMLNVPYYTQDIIKGTVLAAALALTYYRSKK